MQLLIDASVTVRLWTDHPDGLLGRSVADRGRSGLGEDVRRRVRRRGPLTDLILVTLDDRLRKGVARFVDVATPAQLG